MHAHAGALGHLPDSQLHAGSSRPGGPPKPAKRSGSRPKSPSSTWPIHVGAGGGEGTGGGGAQARIPAGDEGELAGEVAAVQDFRRRGAVTEAGADLVLVRTRVGPGWEAHFAVNHLGHHALVNRLWPAVRPGARIVAVSSAGHQLSGIRWADPHFERGYDRWVAYAQAKTANALFAVHLDALGREAGVRAFSVHPGAILTPLLRHLTRAEMVERGWVDEDGRLADPGFKTPEQGAATQVWAATSPQLAGLGGLYCEDCDVAEPTESSDMVSGVRAHATDPGEAARLWALSSRLTGVNAFGSR
ncbi:oxidoreductase [Amycolatopsis sp. NPDC058278]|uniref:oxidoreductase n=1 Tax=Amycolatopsis sp. NPDC058278 TaxID=3346417 RepID=UPI0036D8E147